MKAAVHTRYGPPEVVRVVEVEQPTPSEDEMLVRVRATTVNRTDCATRAAKPFSMRAVTSFAVGDRVGLRWGRGGSRGRPLFQPTTAVCRAGH